MQITMRQLHAALRDTGFYGMASSYAEADAKLAKRWKTPSDVVSRDDPDVERLRKHFGIRATYIDALFKSASSKPGGIRAGQPGGDASWMGLARSYLGIKEVPGRGSNPKIDEFFRDAGHPGYRDETSWCAAFVSAVMVRSGYPRLADLTARSGRYYGQKLDGPKVGCIVVFWRESPSSWKGHIGFVTGIDWNKKTLKVLGGNQNDAVTEATFPMSRVIAYRWPVAPTVKALKSAGSTEAWIISALKRIAISTGVFAIGAESTDALPESAIPSLLAQIETLAAIAAQINGFIAVIDQNKWLILAGLAFVIYHLVQKWQANRLERARRGYPILSQEIDADGGADAVRLD